MASRQEKIAEYIREHIKRAREERQMSQEELGKAIDKTNVTISDIERGRVGVSAVDLALISKALNKPLSYFVPNSVRIRVVANELRTYEQEMMTEYRRIEYYQLQKAITEHVKNIADFTQKSEAGRLLDEAKNAANVLLDKE